jgi:hypothetical protein
VVKAGIGGDRGGEIRGRLVVFVDLQVREAAVRERRRVGLPVGNHAVAGRIAIYGLAVSAHCAA